MKGEACYETISDLLKKGWRNFQGVGSFATAARSTDRLGSGWIIPRIPRIEMRAGGGSCHRPTWRNDVDSSLVVRVAGVHVGSGGGECLGRG